MICENHKGRGWAVKVLPKLKSAKSIMSARLLRHYIAWMRSERYPMCFVCTVLAMEGLTNGATQ